MRLLTSYPRSARDIALLIGRAVLGVIFIAHGWQKLNTNGMEATASGFESMGIPLPTVAAWYAATAELLGGALLIVGALTALAGSALVLNMLGAAWFAHRDGGLFLPNGWEFAISLATAALVLAAVGPGRLSLDHALLAGSRRSRAGARVGLAS